MRLAERRSRRTDAIYPPAAVARINSIMIRTQLWRWRRGVVVSGVRRMNEVKLTHVGPG